MASTRRRAAPSTPQANASTPDEVLKSTAQNVKAQAAAEWAEHACYHLAMAAHALKESKSVPDELVTQLFIAYELSGAVAARLGAHSH